MVYLLSLLTEKSRREKSYNVDRIRKTRFRVSTVINFLPKLNVVTRSCHAHFPLGVTAKVRKRDRSCFHAEIRLATDLASNLSGSNISL